MGQNDHRQRQFKFPAVHGSLLDAEAPLGSGLLIFTAMGAGYAIARRRKPSRYLK